MDVGLEGPAWCDQPSGASVVKLGGPAVAAGTDGEWLPGRQQVGGSSRAVS